MLSMYIMFVVAYLTLYFCGYALKVMLLNDDLKKFDLYITPWFGIGVVVVAFHLLGGMGISIMSSANWFLGAVALVNLAVWLKYREKPRVEGREVIIIAMTGAVAAVVYGGALELAGPDTYAVTMAADYGLYLNLAKAALLSSSREMLAFPAGIPMIKSISDILNMQLRACVYVHSFLSALYGVDLNRSLFPLYAFMMSLNAVTFRPFLKKSGTWGIAVILSMFALNTFYQMMVYLVFMGQMFSFGLVTLALYIEYYLAGREKFDPRTCVALVFVICVNSLCWIEGMVFPLVPVVALAGALFLGKGYDKKACASNAAFVTLLYAVSHVRLITLFVKVFLVLNDAPPAWALPLPTLMNISGLHGFLVPDNAFFAFALISNLIVASALLYQVIREKTTSFLSLSLLTFVALNMIFCAYYYKPGDVRSYSAFKSVMSLSFVIMIFLFRFIDCQLGDFLSRQRDAECGSGIACLIGGAKLPLAATLTAAVFLMMNAYASVTMRRHIASLRGTDVSKIDSALKIFSESPFYGDRNFIINFDEPLMQDLSEYYLPFGRVYSTRNDGRGSRYGVRMVESFNSGDIYASHASYERVARTTDAKDVLFESEVYKVFQLNENSLLLYEYAGMSEKVFIASKDGEFATLRPLIDTKAGPRILCLKERTADVSFSFYDGDVPGSPRGKIYVNGEYRGEAAFDDGYVNVKLEGVAMKRGVNDFIVEFDGDVSNVSLTGLEMF